MGGSRSFAQYSEALIAPVNISTATTTAVVAGVSGQTIRILFICLVTASGAQTIQFADGSNNLTGAMAQGLASGAPQSLILDHHENPIITSPGNSFNVITTTTVGVQGYVMYTQGNS